ncbi:MAG: hypothetical protein JWR61_2101 [Ferruginibacter sp.]|nr:hypothetical protein [Ferruginibacter sp.]
MNQGQAANSNTINSSRYSELKGLRIAEKIQVSR